MQGVGNQGRNPCKHSIDTIGPSTSPWRGWLPRSGQRVAHGEPPTDAPPAGFAEVHIIGTKYIDYFTDGSTTIAVPGDPNIDGNLDKPDAPIPMHTGMTWVHTIGGNLY